MERDSKRKTERREWERVYIEIGVGGIIERGEGVEKLGVRRGGSTRGQNSSIVSN